MHKNETISISSGTIIKTLLIIIAFYLLFILRDIALVILTSITIASAIEPANKKLIKKGVPRILSVVLVFLSLGVFIVGILYFFLPTFIHDTLNLLDALPKYVDSANLWNPLSQTTFLPDFSIKGVVDGLSSTLVDVTGGIFTTVSGIFGGIVSFILIVVLSFYLSVQDDGVGNFLRIVTPIQYEDYVIDLWKRSEQKIGRCLQGQLILGVIVGILTFLGLSILGVSNAIFLAFIAMILELIPIFGIVLAIVPALAVAFTDGGITLSVLVLGLYLIVQQFEAHLIYPLVVRKIVGIPPILVILTLIIGLKLAGFIGVILSVPVAAIIVEIINDVEKKKVTKQVE